MKERQLRNSGIEFPFFLIENDMTSSVCQRSQPRVGEWNKERELARPDVINSPVRQEIDY